MVPSTLWTFAPCGAGGGGVDQDQKTRHTLVRVPGLFVSAARKFGRGLGSRWPPAFWVLNLWNFARAKYVHQHFDSAWNFLRACLVSRQLALGGAKGSGKRALCSS